MRLPFITFVLCACVCLATGDVAHLKATKAKLIGRLTGKHHKRGIFSPVPPFKLGHDIPHVTHSVLKPFVVTYPPTAAVAAVKVPLSPPLGPRYPISVGHKSPHHHVGFHHHTKTLLVPKPDQHFHHHHHHVEPKPVVPVLPATPIVPATPVVPVPQPTGTVVHPVPAPSPHLLLHPAPEPVLPAPPVPIAPPPVNFFGHNHFHSLKPIVPLAPAVPIQPAHAHAAPVVPLAPQIRYLLRPGNAVQTSFFATYPRYPFGNFHQLQSPLVPLPLAPPPAPVLPASFGPILPPFLGQPQTHLVPQGGVLHDAHAHGVIQQHSPPAAVEPTLLHPTQAAIPQHAVHLQPVQPTVHLQPAQPTAHLQPQPAGPLDHDGWSPVVTQSHDLAPSPQPDAHFPQQLDPHQFTQEQGTQVYEHHTGSDQQYHDYQNQLQHHIQHQIEQAQYEQNLNNQHQLGQEYGAPQQEYGQPNHEYQQNQDFAQHAHEYAQHIQEYAQHGGEYAQTNEYHQQQPTQEYGAPQGLEGRSGDGEGEEGSQRFHNHIPLGLQPPIDRPLEHFR